MTIRTPHNQNNHIPRITDILGDNNNHQMSDAIQDLLYTTSQIEHDTTIRGEYNIPHDIGNTRELLYETYQSFKYQMRKIHKKEISDNTAIYLYRQLQSFTKTLMDINSERFDMTLAETSIETDHAIRSFMMDVYVNT